MKDLSHNISAENVMQFIRTPAGQQLLAMLQGSTDKNLLQAKDLIAQGNIEGAKALLKDMANSAQFQSLLPKQENK